MSGKPTLLDAAETSAPTTAIAPIESGGVTMFERLASDQNVSVEKIDRLMALWERNEAKKAESAFNAGMAEAQAVMRPVAADANNPQTHSKYASYAALDRALRPIYTEHGFGLSFNTGECAVPEYVRVLCKVTHRAGHSEEYHIDMPADGKGAKGGDVMMKTHAAGSAVSYGMRYLLKMIFNVAVGEDDDDGNKAGQKVQRAAPAGYEDWLDEMTAAADGGREALRAAYTASKKEFCAYVAATDVGWTSRMKARAAAATAKTEKGDR